MYSLKDLADLMFPNNKYTVEELEKNIQKEIYLKE